MKLRRSNESQTSKTASKTFAKTLTVVKQKGVKCMKKENPVEKLLEALIINAQGGALTPYGKELVVDAKRELDDLYSASCEARFKKAVGEDVEVIKYKECSLCGDRFINERDKGKNEAKAEIRKCWEDNRGDI